MLQKMSVALVLLAVSLSATPAPAQLANLQPMRLGGPRFGVTVITGSNADRLRDEFSVHPVVTQFGWQFETVLFRSATGVAALSEWVPLVGGMEQGAFLPSLSWLVGLRTANGAELAVGPNLSMAGAGLAIAAGVTFQAGGLNLPLNMAIVPSDGGLRVSFLGGFNTRR